MADEDLMIGQVLGNYTITQKLGQGAMGVVYLAEHSPLHRQVAIKFLAGQYCSDKLYVDRFLQEARAAARLQHPNIVAVYDAGVVDKVYYIVMEYVRGKDLAYMLDEGEIFEEPQALYFIQHIASGLAYAHEHGIIHRDVKPENLFLTPEGQIKLGDLGLATWANDPIHTGATGQVMGTAFYMSPEQICNPRNVDARTDIYSLGATLFHLVTGLPPFLGESIEEVVQKHLKAPLPSPKSIRPNLSDEMCRFLGKMLAKDVTERYQNMNEVLAALTLIERRKANPDLPTSDDTQAVALQRTMTLLRKGLQGKTDFPSIVGPMNVISKLSTSGHTVSVDELTEVILSDFSLTNKLLKLVNSAFYSAGDQKIGTISRAILVLGLAQVRNAALSLMLFQNLDAGQKQRAKEVRDASINNFLSGILARNLSERIGGVNKEEAFICSVFFNLGKLICTFYLLDDKRKIDERVMNDKVHEQIASVSILGISYEELGAKMAAEWNFPEQIITTMKKPATMEIPKPTNLLEKLRSIAYFSNELCALLRNLTATPEELDSMFNDLIIRFQNCFLVTTDELGEIINKSLNDLDVFAGSLGLSVELDEFAHVDDPTSEADKAESA